MYSIAFVTYKKTPGLSEDDQKLISSLAMRGIQFRAIPWNESDVAWNQFDAVIIRSCWDYYLHYDEFLIWLDSLKAAQVKVYNTIDLMRWNSDKMYLKEIQAKGFTIPGTIWIGKNEEKSLHEILKRNKWEKAVVKPCISAGAYETWLIDEHSSERYQNQFSKAVQDRSFMIQEYLEEINLAGEISLVFFQNEYSHSVIKHPDSMDFRVQIKFGGSVQPYDPSPYEIKTAQRIVRECAGGNVLYARVDGVLRQGEFVLMELELIEPSLYFSFGERSAETFCDAVLSVMCS